MDERRGRRLRRMLGTDEPITDGFFVTPPPQSPTLLDSVPLPDVIAGIIVGVAAISGAVGFLRRRGETSDRPAPLPAKKLAVALVGDEFLVGRRGRVLRRVPEHELLTTLRRPRLSTEMTIDGQAFVAGGREGDLALRLQRTRGARARPAGAGQE